MAPPVCDKKSYSLYGDNFVLAVYAVYRAA